MPQPQMIDSCTMHYEGMKERMSFKEEIMSYFYLTTITSGLSELILNQSCVT